MSPARARKKDQPTTWEGRKGGGLSQSADKLNTPFQKGQMASPQGFGSSAEVPSIVFSSSNWTTIDQSDVSCSPTLAKIFWRLHGISRSVSCVPLSSPPLASSKRVCTLHVLILTFRCMSYSSPKAKPYSIEKHTSKDEHRVVISGSATRVQPSTCFTRVEARRPGRLEPLGGGNGPQREPELFHPRVCVRWALLPPARHEPNHSFRLARALHLDVTREINNSHLEPRETRCITFSTTWPSEQPTQDLHRPRVDGSWDAWQRGRHIPAVHFLIRSIIALHAIQPTWRPDLIAAEE